MVLFEGIHSRARALIIGRSKTLPCIFPLRNRLGYLSTLRVRQGNDAAW